MSSPVHKEYMHLDKRRIQIPSVSGLSKYFDHYLYIYFHIIILMDFVRFLSAVDEWNLTV